MSAKRPASFVTSLLAFPRSIRVEWAPLTCMATASGRVGAMTHPLADAVPASPAADITTMAPVHHLFDELALGMLRRMESRETRLLLCIYCYFGSYSAFLSVLSVGGGLTVPGLCLDLWCSQPVRVWQRQRQFRWI